MARELESIFGAYFYTTENEIADGGHGRVYIGKFEKIENNIDVDILKKIAKGEQVITIEENVVINVNLERKIANREEVAIKVLFAESAKRQDILQMSSDAVRLNIDNDNVVKLYAFIEKNDKFHECMEYIPGEDLSKILDKAIKNNKVLTFDYIYPIVLQVLDGLSAIHNRNTCHRDLDISNIMVSNKNFNLSQNETLNDVKFPEKGDDIKIIDLGITHRMDKKDSSASGTKRGKIPSMSPQQLAGETPHPNWDLYALGICIYELLTGRLPFEIIDEKTKKLDQEKTGQLIREEVLPRHKNIKDPIYAFLRKATAKETDERFFNCDDFRYEWEQLGKQMKNQSSFSLANLMGGLKVPSVDSAWLRRLTYGFGILAIVLGLKFLLPSNDNDKNSFAESHQVEEKKSPNTNTNEVVGSSPTPIRVEEDSPSSSNNTNQNGKTTNMVTNIANRNENTTNRGTNNGNTSNSRVDNNNQNPSTTTTNNNAIDADQKSLKSRYNRILNNSQGGLDLEGGFYRKIKDKTGTPKKFTNVKQYRDKWYIIQINTNPDEDNEYDEATTIPELQQFIK